jgi:hypothetical protein
MEGNEAKYTFEPEGVDVYILQQEREIVPRRQPLGDTKDYPGIPGYFEPTRLVINLGFYFSDESEEEIDTLGATARIEVRYNAGDVENAGGDYHDLKLGFFWQGAWHRFESKHSYELVPDDVEHPNEGGRGVAMLESWEDPAIGWDN